MVQDEYAAVADCAVEKQCRVMHVGRRWRKIEGSRGVPPLSSNPTFRGNSTPSFTFFDRLWASHVFFFLSFSLVLLETFPIPPFADM